MVVRQAGDEKTDNQTCDADMCHWKLNVKKFCQDHSQTDKMQNKMEASSFIELHQCRRKITNQFKCESILWTVSLYRPWTRSICWHYSVFICFCWSLMCSQTKNCHTERKTMTPAVKRPRIDSDLHANICWQLEASKSDRSKDHHACDLLTDGLLFSAVSTIGLPRQNTVA